MEAIRVLKRCFYAGNKPKVTRVFAPRTYLGPDVTKHWRGADLAECF